MAIYTSSGDVYDDELEFTRSQFDPARAEKAPVDLNTLWQTEADQAPVALDDTSRPKPDFWDRLPGAIAQEGKNIFNSVVELVKSPGDSYKGNLTPDEITDRGIGLGELVGLSTLPTAGLRPGIGMFGGRVGAQNVAKSADRIAEAGRRLINPTPEERLNTFLDTGVFQGPDAKLRFEIPDALSSLNMEAFEPAKTSGWKFNNDTWKIEDVPHFKPKDDVQTIGELIHHPDLFAHYPDLKDIPVQLHGPPGYGGMHWSEGMDKYGERIFIAPNSLDEIHSVLLHELQHAVQDREGFTSGGNLSTFLPKGEEYTDLVKLRRQAENILSLDWKDLEKTYKKNYGDVSYIVGKAQRGLSMKPEEKDFLYQLQSEQPNYVRLMQLYKNADKLIEEHNSAAREHYQALYGEVEARMTQERRNLSSQELIDMPPFVSNEFKKTYPDAVIESKYVSTNKHARSGEVAEPERITHLAVKDVKTGRIETHPIASGKIHLDVMDQFGPNQDWGSLDSGFLTNKGRFVNRKEAQRISEEQDQLNYQAKKRAKNNVRMDRELDSLDLKKPVTKEK